MGAHTLSLNPQPPYMKSLSFKLSPSLTFSPPSKLRPFCSLSLIPYSHGTSEIEPNPTTTKRGLSKIKSKVADAAGLKQTWLDSISCPFLDKTHFNWDSARVNDGSHWVIGIDPDVSGALALLKTDHSGFSAQVFDSPNLRVRVGKGLRKRLDTRAIVQMIQRLEVPMGTSAFIEQSIPYPQDGKQGWYSGGFGYGLWIGILVASGFSVVPVPSLAWKNVFKLASGRSTKAGNVYFPSLLKLVIIVAAEIYGDSPLDDNRRVASTLFPSMSSLLQRKKDHGRAEALLIAAYGRGQELKLEDSSVGMNYTAEVVNPVDSPPLHISVGEC